METNRMTIIRNNPQPRLSASVAYGNLLFLSGQTPKSSEDDIVLQTREVLEKIDALLAAAGSDKRQILSAQIWLKDIERDFVAFNDVGTVDAGRPEPGASSSTGGDGATGYPGGDHAHRRQSVRTCRKEKGRNAAFLISSDYLSFGDAFSTRLFSF